MKTYIAGPMTGRPNLNFPAFHAEAARLRALGHEVINPAEINGGEREIDECAGMTEAELAQHWVACMRKDIKALVDCDGIHMLAGWQKSRGAKIEHYIASALGLSVTYSDDARFEIDLESDLREAAWLIISKARNYGCVLTISQHPRLPLAMGNYDTVVDVRPARVES